jgi:hypothetical protein
MLEQNTFPDDWNNTSQEWGRKEGYHSYYLTVAPLAAYPK